MDKAPSIEERLGAFLEPEEASPEAPQTPADAGVPVSEAPKIEKAEPPPVEETEEQEITTLNELAEALGADVADLYNIKLAVDIDGKGKEEITLGQYKDLYRDSKVIETRRAELDKRVAEIDALHKQKVEAFEAKERETAEVLNYMEQNLFQKYAGIDWNALRQSDPGQWAALSFQLEQEKAQFAQLRSTAAMKWDNAKRELAEAEAARDREVSAKEWQQMMDAVPEWKDPVKYEHDSVQLKSFLIESGFTPDEISKIRLRQVLLARDAMRYREMTKQASVAKNKVFKIGKKVLTSGTRTGANEQGSERQNSLRGKLRKSGNYRDAAALFSEALKG